MKTMRVKTFNLHRRDESSQILLLPVEHSPKLFTSSLSRREIERRSELLRSASEGPSARSSGRSWSAVQWGWNATQKRSRPRIVSQVKLLPGPVLLVHVALSVSFGV